jgi:transcriptional regulator with XRE-family HTH domain
MVPEKSFEFRSDVAPLRQIREALGLSRRKFGDLFDVTEETVRRWETGVNSINWDWQQVKTFIRIAISLGIDLESLPDVLTKPPDNTQS